jgi:hypothetical protein
MMINDLPDEDDDAEKPEDENAETPDRSVEEVQALARSLGFALMPQDGGDDDEGVGYFVLISTAGDHPLGPDAVSITDIVRLLTEYAADLGEEVDDEIDINEHLKKQKPPPGAKKKAAAILKADKPRLDEVAIDDPLMAERIRDHNAQVMQDRWLKRTNQSTALHDPESEQDTFYREYDPALTSGCPNAGAVLCGEPLGLGLHQRATQERRNAGRRAEFSNAFSNSWRAITITNTADSTRVPAKKP